MRKLLYAGAVVVGLLAAGCGGAETQDAEGRVAADDTVTPEASPTDYAPGMTPPGTGYSPSPTSPIMVTPTGPTTIAAAQTDLGAVLVGVENRTVYLFTKDKNGQTTCTGACATAWPPVLTAGNPVAGTGVKAHLLGTIKRDDGGTQVTYNKHPLYYYAKDQKAGDTLGQDVKDFGGEWYAVTPEGKRAKR
jgi:predicted lipoprotein with Yx(FWY)xxD motif